ncbi:UNVERIFIED_CONTAM: hypothetical protein NCL1_51611 [Trichonephila clavipes]
MSQTVQQCFRTKKVSPCPFDKRPLRSRTHIFRLHSISLPAVEGSNGHRFQRTCVCGGSRQVALRYFSIGRCSSYRSGHSLHNPTAFSLNGRPGHLQQRYHSWSSGCHSGSHSDILFQYRSVHLRQKSVHHAVVMFNFGLIAVVEGGLLTYVFGDFKWLIAAFRNGILFCLEF